MKRILMTLLAAGLLCAAGCGGPKSSTASGKVTMGGQPVTNASINFMDPSTGAVASCDLDASGSFKIMEGLPAGSYKVFVVPKAAMDRPPMPGEPPPEMKASPVPEKYRNESSTDLKADIKPGPNEGLSFTLEGAPS
ncbi:MAG: carboxypeptidase-like regulatory domain-containing protein [Pirellulales bacterium]